jgi:hygromycin-B 7''-O-kinase
MAVARDPERFVDGHLWYWVRWAQADAEERSDAEFDAQVTTPEVLAELKDRSIVRSAAGMFDQPIMQLRGDAGREAVVRAQPWLTMAGRVCAEKGIPVERQLEPTFASTYPTVLAPPEHVIKFFSRRQPSRAVHVAEARALRRAARDPGLPVPRLVASGRLDDWRYLVMTRVPGQALTFLLDTLDGSVVRDIATWTGEFVRRLHTIELTVGEVDAADAEFATFIDHRHAEAPARLADRGALPDRLLDEVSAWLPSPQEMLDASGHPVFVHGGLQDDHIMVTGRDEPRGLRAVAVIDFGDALVGHPYFELGPAWWTWLNADRDYLDAFLEAAQLPGWGGPGFARMALAWTLIRCSWNPKAPPFLNDAHDLDELAELSFGSRC